MTIAVKTSDITPGRRPTPRAATSTRSRMTTRSDCRAISDIWPVTGSLRSRSNFVIAACVSEPTIPVGFNRPDQHDRIVAEAERLLPLIALAKLPNMIVFSGNRAGLSDAEGLEHCVRGLLRVTPLAERRGVTGCMELLNSKVDHKD